MSPGSCFGRTWELIGFGCRAPFNAAYVWDNSSTNLIINDPVNSVLNTFVGNEYQQTSSVVTNTNQECYTGGGGCFSTYGFEYSPGTNGYIQWVNDAKAVWEIKGAGMNADSATLISQRPVPEEPMVRPPFMITLGVMLMRVGIVHFGEPGHVFQLWLDRL